MGKTLSTKNIALFGTSADPPTAGHQTILRWLSQHYDLVVVWASNNPFKKHQSSLQDRSEMLDLVIQEIELVDNIILSQKISDRKTLITLKKAREIWHDAKFTLVIGSDLLKQITTWYQIEKLLQQVKILVVPRPGYAIKESDLSNLEAIGGQYTIATLNAPRVSSSNYRLRGDTAVITPEVENYIKDKNLYSNQTT